MTTRHEKRLFVGAFVAAVFICVGFVVTAIPFEAVFISALIVGVCIAMYVLGWVSLAIHEVVTE